MKKRKARTNCPFCGGRTLKRYSVLTVRCYDCGTVISPWFSRYEKYRTRLVFGFGWTMGVIASLILAVVINFLV